MVERRPVDTVAAIAVRHEHRLVARRGRDAERVFHAPVVPGRCRSPASAASYPRLPPGEIARGGLLHSPRAPGQPAEVPRLGRQQQRLVDGSAVEGAVAGGVEEPLGVQVWRRLPPAPGVVTAKPALIQFGARTGPAPSSRTHWRPPARANLRSVGAGSASTSWSSGTRREVEGHPRRVGIGRPTAIPTQRLHLIRARAFTGVPASTPSNSPVCHCLPSDQSGSASRASNALGQSRVTRARASRRHQFVTDGGMTNPPSRHHCVPEVRRHGVARHVDGKPGRRGEPAAVGQGVEVDHPQLGQLQRLEQGRLQRLERPDRLRARGRCEQDCLRGAAVGAATWKATPVTVSVLGITSIHSSTNSPATSLPGSVELGGVEQERQTPGFRPDVGRRTADRPTGPWAAERQLDSREVRARQLRRIGTHGTTGLQSRRETLPAASGRPRHRAGSRRRRTDRRPSAARSCRSPDRGLLDRSARTSGAVGWSPPSPADPPRRGRPTPNSWPGPRPGRRAWPRVVRPRPCPGPRARPPSPAGRRDRSTARRRRRRGQPQPAGGSEGRPSSGSGLPPRPPPAPGS